MNNPAIFLFCLFSFVSLRSSSQELILNGGFEEENICTEYQKTCAPEAWFGNMAGFDNYIKDAQQAYRGTHCISIEAGHSVKPYERTFIRSQFTCPLVTGHKYRLQLFIRSRYKILDSMGVYFGNIDPLFERKPIHLLAPSFFLIDGGYPLQGADWQMVELDYTSKGGEQYITIANFSRNDIKGSTGFANEKRFIVFIDNVSLEPLNPNERVCANWRQVKEEIYEQNERHHYLDRLIKNYQQNKPREPLPLKPGKPPVAIIDTLVLPDILFETGKASLYGNSHRYLDSLLKQLSGRAIDSIVVKGHTDNTGTAELNEGLSLGRAKTVDNYIAQSASEKAFKLIVYAMADRSPVADNSTPQGRQKNRRVEILAYIRE